MSSAVDARNVKGLREIQTEQEKTQMLPLNSRYRVWYFLVIIILITSSLVVSSCRADQNAASEKKQVVVTYSVLGSLVQELVEQKAEVFVIIPNGLDPHEWEPSARDIERINKADLVIQNGLDLEFGLHKTLANAANKGVSFFTASDFVDIRYIGEDEIAEEHDDHAAHELSEEHQHDVGAPDPHIWTDPESMKKVLQALSGVLKSDLGLDVSAELIVMENKLNLIDQEVRALIEQVPAQDRKLITGHNSMGYYARRYGLTVIGTIIPSISTQAGVSAADMASLKHAIEENGVKALFTELGTSPALARQIGEETGARVVPIASHLLPEDGSYFTMIRNLTQTIVEAVK